MKYIVFQDNSVIVFPDSQSHNNMAMNKVVRSAGFCRIETYRTAFDDIRARVHCYGKSDTLGVESCKDDEELIEAFWT